MSLLFFKRNAGKRWFSSHVKFPNKQPHIYSCIYRHLIKHSFFSDGRKIETRYLKDNCNKWRKDICNSSALTFWKTTFISRLLQLILEKADFLRAASAHPNEKIYISLFIRFFFLVYVFWYNWCFLYGNWKM